MKAKELIKLLEENPEFDVEISINNTRDTDKWINLEVYNITGIEDIGYSDKIIRLNLEKQ